jgi:hypothetical protein
MNSKIVRSLGRITNRRKNEREREIETERREIMNAKVKRTYRTMLRKDVDREDEEIL